MNILPKKRWHVRTKDNIARVRKDEAEAARLEEEKKHKSLLAEREARINYLKKSKHNTDTELKSEPVIPSSTSHGHINLFSTDDSDIIPVVKDNPEYIKEKKEEKEKYEKQIGYLTYLGQDTNEALKLKSWYEISPAKRKLYIDDDKQNKTKKLNDPFELFKHKNSKEEKQNSKNHPDSIKTLKKSNKECGSKKKSIEELRAERLKREKAEKLRQEMLLKKFEPEPKPSEVDSTGEPKRIIKQRYNNQFNPMFARQNM